MAHHTPDQWYRSQDWFHIPESHLVTRSLPRQGLALLRDPSHVR